MTTTPKQKKREEQEERKAFDDALRQILGAPRKRRVTKNKQGKRK